jgi:glycerophosphoryl diester phosphodiesterase
MGTHPLATHKRLSHQPRKASIMPVTSTLSKAPPIVIAHRGASGYLPEHTIAAYKLAIEQGADFIEPDLVSTKDGVLIARHEANLMATTNIADLAQFADRRKTITIDGTTATGFYTNDFTLAEIKTLRARQPRSFRDQSHNDQFEIPTLQEIIDLIKQTEAQTHRQVGIYPETKHPTYFDQLGLSLEEPLIETLLANQFTDRERVFIQSFEVTNLKDQLPQLMATAGINLPLVQLFGAFDQQPYDLVIRGDDRTYSDLISRDLRDFVATYAAGIGLWKQSIVLTQPIELPSGAAEQLTGTVLPVIEDAHAAGLLVHLYTFRNEAQFLAVDYNGDPAAEYQQFFELGADGVFSDFPDTAIAARNALKAAQNFRPPDSV